MFLAFVVVVVVVVVFVVVASSVVLLGRYVSLSVCLSVCMCVQVFGTVIVPDTWNYLSRMKRNI